MIEEKSKKRFFWFFTLTFPVAVIAVTELILRWANFGNNLDLVFVQEFNGKQYYTVNRSVARRYFPLHSVQLPQVYDGTFEVVKSPKTYRIFLLGESTMQGFPYEYNGALHRLLENRLAQLFPDRTIEIINLGITAVNSYAVLDLMREVVNYKPDLIIVYLGHNEFYGSFGVGSIEFIGKNRSLINFYLRLEHFKIVQALHKAVDVVHSVVGKDDLKLPSSTIMQLMAREKAILYNSNLYTIAKENFEKNLSDIADIAVSQHVPLMLSTVVSNLRDQPPFISEFSELTNENAREHWSVLVNKGNIKQADKQFDEALARYAEASRIDSTRADLQYDMGVCFEALGNIAEAKRHFAKARDFDLLRFRATDEFNNVIKEIAGRRNLMLADIVKTFEENSTNTIVGKSLMLEHVHPNLDGYFLIAKEYVRVMREYDCISSKDEWKLPLSDDEYKSLSQMTLFDFEVSFLRIDNLLHHWPFTEPESTRYRPTGDEGQLAVKYLQGKIDWEHAHYELADFYKSRQRFTDAAREYLAIAKVLRFDFNPLVLAGDANLTMKNYREAGAIYRLALKRADNQFVNVRLGALFSEMGIFDSAVYYYRTALERDVHATSKLKQEWKLELMQHLAEEYIKKGDVLHAREEALNILSVNPLDAKAKQLLDKLSAVADSIHAQ